MLKRIIQAIVVLIIGIIIYNKFRIQPLPTLNPDPWWGPGKRGTDDINIQKFTIKVPQKDLDDFETRLALPPRYVEGLEDAYFTYGFRGEVLEEVVQYWKEKYDWRKRESILNAYPHFKTQIEGLNIHFLHIKPKIDKTSKLQIEPLLLLHGWPGSFIEFLQMIPLLTRPKETSNIVFEIVIPSLPGYGFSQASSKKGLGAMETSQIFRKLMERLGHEKFYVQGGDWGSLIGTNMGILFPKSIKGLHVNMFAANTPMTRLKIFLGAYLPSGIIIDEKDQHKLYPMGEFFSKMLRESGYLHIQATKPDTIGNALNTSPVALLTYIMEKFSTWTNPIYTIHPSGGFLDSTFPISMDSILDNICIYWFTNSIVSSQRYYAENLNAKTFEIDIDSHECNVPTGIAVFANDIIVMPEFVARDKYPHLVTFKDYKTGGHFAALERPKDLSDHVFEFVNLVEQKKKLNTK